MTGIEDRLRRMHPAGPPPELRDRILRDSTPPARQMRAGLDWLLPLAAAATAAILFTLATRQRQFAAVDLSGDPSRTMLEYALTEQLGGDSIAADLAEQIVRVEFIEEAPVE